MGCGGRCQRSLLLGSSAVGSGRFGSEVRDQEYAPRHPDWYRPQHLAMYHSLQNTCGGMKCWGADRAEETPSKGPEHLLELRERSKQASWRRAMVVLGAGTLQ